MKKIISFIFVLFLVGCSKQEYFTCNIEVNNKIDNYTLTGNYKIYYNDNYVTKIEKQEEYESEDEYILSYFQESKDLEYYNLNDNYKGFEHKITKGENNVRIKVAIDMNLVEVEKMVKDKKIDKNYVISNKLTTSGIVKIYETKGAVCNK